MTEDSGFVDAPPCRIPIAELSFSYARSGGPGGQNVNKVETKVVLRFDFEGSPSIPEPIKDRARPRLSGRLTNAGEIVMACDSERSRERNRSEAVKRFTSVLVAAFEEERPRRPTRPTRSSVRRRLDGKRRQGDRKKERSERWD